MLFLTVIKIQVNGGKMKHSVFLSGSWFSPEEEKMLESMKRGLKHNDKVEDVYWCLDSQMDGIDVTKHPEVAAKYSWKIGTYNTDIAGIKSQDIMTVMVVPGHEDSGASVEMGYASALGKPIILVLPDWAYYPKSKAKINLMVGMVADDVIPLSCLPTYDFDHIRHHPYDGEVY